MTTQRQLRKTALGLLRAQETVDDRGRAAFAVDGRVFAHLEPAQVVFLALPEAEIATMATAHPTAEVVEENGRRTGVRLALSEIDGQKLNQWVRRAWAAQAPTAIAENAAAAASLTAGQVGDLPAAIGRTTTRALADLGITSLDRIAAMSDRELLDIHGVGPKAVRLLRAHDGSVTG